MKKSLLILISLFVIVEHLSAQIDPLYAQYLSNPLLINPAYTGVNNNFSGAVSYRRQWAGLEGNPVTLNVSGQLSLINNKIGLGGIVLTDNIGNNSNTEAYLTYSYKVFMSDGVLSFGLQAGMINYRSRNGDLNPYDVTDPAFSGDLNVTNLSVGAGLLYRSDRLFIGVSVPRMLKQESNYQDVVTNLYSQHFYVNAAYIFFLSERVRVKPAVLFKGVQGSPLSVDYSALLNLDEKYTAGIYTRNLNTFGALLQFKPGGAYQLGYCLELPTNQSVGMQYTTHEFSLGLNLSLLSFHENNQKSF